jgi:tryptophanyl-tRNA synthetase
MLTDDEKFYHNKALTQEDCRKFATANAKDILGIGFDMKKTFMFIDSDFFNHFASGAFNYNVREMAKRLNFNQVKGAFGHHEGYVALNDNQRPD